MGWNIQELFQFSFTHMMLRSTSLQILYRKVQCIFLTPAMMQSKGNGSIPQSMLILHIFSLHILSCDLPYPTGCMRHNTGQQNQLTDSQLWKTAIESTNSWVGCLDTIFPHEEGKQFSIKISSFCALSMIIVSASRNQQSNLQCIFSEYHFWNINEISEYQRNNLGIF